MQELLNKIASLIDSIWTVAQSLLTSIWEFIELLLTIPEKIGAVLSFLPAEVLSMILGIITVVVAMRIAGRH